MSASSSSSSSFPVVLSCLLAPACVFGADVSGTEELERVLVSANRIEQPLSRIGDSVTLIDAEQVRASQKSTVSDLLAATPGITVTRNGGLGGSTQLRIRGAESDQTVVLIDGVKLNDPSSAGGGFNFANLLTGDYMRIEVLRGPQSTLWGSQAIGGVVNIVTPIPEGPLIGRILRRRRCARLGDGASARARLAMSVSGGASGQLFDDRRHLRVRRRPAAVASAMAIATLASTCAALYRHQRCVTAELRSTW